MGYDESLQVLVYIDPPMASWSRSLLEGTDTAEEIADCFSHALKGTSQTHRPCRPYYVTQGGLIAAGSPGFISLAKKLRALKAATELAIAEVDAVLELQSTHSRAERI